MFARFVIFQLMICTVGNIANVTCIVARAKMRLFVTFQCHFGEVAGLVGTEFAFEYSFGLVMVHPKWEKRDEHYKSKVKHESTQ